MLSSDRLTHSWAFATRTSGIRVGVAATGMRAVHALLVRGGVDPNPLAPPWLRGMAPGRAAASRSDPTTSCNAPAAFVLPGDGARRAWGHGPNLDGAGRHDAVSTLQRNPIGDDSARSRRAGRVRRSGGPVRAVRRGARPRRPHCTPLPEAGTAEPVRAGGARRAAAQASRPLQPEGLLIRVRHHR